jgi:hypothetical protein
MRTSENTPSETVRKGGTSNAPSMDLASMRRKKWAERPLFGVLLDHAAGAFGTFRTVSEEVFSEVRMQHPAFG